MRPAAWQFPLRSPQPNRFRDDRRPVLRHVRYAFFMGLLMYGVMAVAEHVALRRLPAGEAYVLTSHGWGSLCEFGFDAIVLTWGSICITLSVFNVRGLLGLILRFVMFLLFGVFLVWFQANTPVAVVKTSDAFLLVRRLPLAPLRIAPGQIDEVRVRHRTMSRELAIIPKAGADMPKYIELEAVWDVDRQTGAILDRLVTALHGDKTPTPHGTVFKPIGADDVAGER